MSVGDDLVVANVIHLEGIIVLDVRRELHAIGDVTELLHCKGLVRVHLRDVNVGSTVVYAL